VLHRYKAFLNRTSAEALRLLTLTLLVPVFVLGHLSPAPPWAWALTILFIIASVAVAVPWIVRTQAAPDRAPIVWGERGWLVAVATIAGLLILGPASIASRRPVWSGAVPFILGCGSLALLIRHVRRPVRPPAPKPSDWDPPVPRGWRMFR
jgi:hypothetical protein